MTHKKPLRFPSKKLKEKKHIRFTKRMPNGWEQYLLGPNGFVNRGGISSGGIYCSKSGQIWAEMNMSSSNSNSIKNLTKLFIDPSPAFTSGFSINNQKFTLLRVDPVEGLLQGRSKVDSRSITVVKTKMAVVVAIGEPDTVGGEVSVTVGKVCDYLKEKGF